MDIMFLSGLAENENRSFILLIFLGGLVLLWMNRFISDQKEKLEEERKEDKAIKARLMDQLDKAQEINGKHGETLGELVEEVKKIQTNQTRLENQVRMADENNRIEFNRLWSAIKEEEE